MAASGRLHPCLLTLVLAGSLPAVEFHVAITGDDVQPGTAAAPFRTIAKAREAVRPLLADMHADVVVTIHGGTHALGEPLYFTADDSGRNGFNVIYRAAVGEIPVLSGGRSITGWKQIDPSKNIWQAPAPGIRTRQLYVDGRKGVRARSPGKVLPDQTVQDGKGYLVPGDLPMRSWRNPEAIEFVYTATLGGTGVSIPDKIGKGAEWTEIRLGVAAFTEEAGQTRIAMKLPGYGMCYRPTGSWQDKFQSVYRPTHVENAYELLDEPGEWYLDQTAGTLSCIPCPGEDLTRAVVMAPLLEQVLVGSGSPALHHPFHHVRFQGLTFAHTTWLHPDGPKGFAELQAGELRDGAYVTGAVRIMGGSDVVIERCLFTGLGGSGIEVGGGSTGCVVAGCRFDQVSGNAIRLGTIHDPQRKDEAKRDVGNRIVNCAMEGVPGEYHGCPSILVGYTADSLIAHNDIRHASYSGISVGWGWGAANYAKGNRVIANRVIGYKELLADGGGWYALGPQPGSELSGNVFQTEVHGGSGGAIYPDEASTGWDIHHNVVEVAADRRWAFIWTKTIKDLTLHDNWMTSAMIRNEGTGIVLTNNQLVSGPWPVAARAVIDAAGLEREWKDVAVLGMKKRTMASP